jgi:hypothetical protein
MLQSAVVYLAAPFCARRTASTVGCKQSCFPLCVCKYKHTRANTHTHIHTHTHTQVHKDGRHFINSASTHYIHTLVHTHTHMRAHTHTHTRQAQTRVPVHVNSGDWVRRAGGSPRPKAFCRYWRIEKHRQVRNSAIAAKLSAAIPCINKGKTFPWKQDFVCRMLNPNFIAKK